MSHFEKLGLTDEVFYTHSPRFKAASLGKLGEALVRHIQEFPDVLQMEPVIKNESSIAASEDI